MSWVSPDSQDMLGATVGLPEQLEVSASAAADVTGLPSPDGLRAIVVLGMGGSGVAGEVLQAIAKDHLRLPVVLVADYSIPSFVDQSTLVFAVSFSGETEETLEAADAALRRGARLIAVAGGGRLADLASASGAPVFATLEGIPQPRAGIASTAAPLLVACERLGLMAEVIPAIGAAVDQLRRRRESLVGGGGLALEISQRLDRTIPLIQGANGIGAVAARRWKTQVNENAKAPAFFATQPEWCHNEICGFGQNGDVTRQVMTIVALRTDFEHPQVARRFSLVEELVGEAVASVIEVRADGSGPLAQLFDLVMIGDFVSLQLAAREGIDPGPVPVLVEVKRFLSASTEQAAR
ncbi:MAG TPA: bifunctional phosphoglucose/phosphomannose isomerase [Acidimicrobiales bacterium]|nr:bifunctional phosphoglucose/phosphomannose isomerase [Acidimicrobiales bacterium]